MARPTGQVELPTNIEVLFKWMFDARMMAENKSDLTLFTADHKIPLGFPVFVQGKENSSERGIYLCIDDTNVSSTTSWELYGGGSDVEVIDDLVTGGTDKALSAQQGVVLKTFIDDINALLSSDDTTLDEFQEVVNFIKANKQDLENLGISNIAGLQAALDGKLNDAPSNGSLFGRKDGVWTEIDLTIVANSIDNSMLAQMPEATLKGRAAGAGVGNVQNLTKEQVKAILNYIAEEIGIDTSSFLHSTATNLFELAEDFDLSLDQIFTDLSSKLNKGGYTGTAQDLKNLIDDFQGFSGNYADLTGKPTAEYLTLNAQNQIDLTNSEGNFYNYTSAQTPTSEVNFVTTGINKGSYAFIRIKANTNNNVNSITINGTHNPVNPDVWVDNADMLIKIHADTNNSFYWKFSKF